MKESAIVQASTSLGISKDKITKMIKSGDISLKGYEDGGFKIVANSVEAQSLITTNHAKTIFRK